MAYPIYIEIGNDSLMDLENKFMPVSDDRFFYCLQQKNWKIDQVHTYNASLRICFDYIAKEYERMKELRKVFNQHYPSNHKHYFSTLVELLSKMRSTISAYKKILDKFRPKKSKKGSITYDPTTLHNGPYSKNAFGWDIYQEKAIKELLDNINNILKLASDVYEEAMGIIADENTIRSNPDLAYPVYEKSFQHSVQDNDKLIEALKASNGNIDHNLVKAFETAKDVRLLIASLFHEITFSDFNYFCACKVISDGRKVGLTDEESLKLGNYDEKVVVRLWILLDHIQVLAEQRDDVIGWKDMLSGKFVMHLHYWCGWNGSKNEELLKYITKRCKGKIGVVKMGAVMAEKRKLAYVSNDVQRNEQNIFNKEMDAFVDSMLPKSDGKAA